MVLGAPAGLGLVSVGNDHAQVYWVDCLTHLRTMASESVHAVITDPPYGLSDHSSEQVTKALMAWASGDRERVPDPKGGFMGRGWDSFVPPPAVWDECMRVLVPGGHMAVFAGSRTVDLMGLSIRLAGFEMRDGIAAWLYGSGFPKSLDVSKALDKRAGVEPIVLGPDEYKRARANRGTTSDIQPSYDKPREAQAQANITAPATDAAREWSGWGTALKPAMEPIILARKPFTGTVVANVLEYRAGAINVDACRVAHASAVDLAGSEAKNAHASFGSGARGHGSTYQGAPAADRAEYDGSAGRWPTNIVLAHVPALDPVTGEVVGDACADGCADGCQVAALDEQSGTLTSGAWNGKRNRQKFETNYGDFEDGNEPPRVGDSGGASRFFPTFRYQAKAPKGERPQAWGKPSKCRCPVPRPFDPQTGALPPRWRQAGFDVKPDGTRIPYGVVCAGCERPAEYRGHSTVKPQGLLRWLTDLLVAPGGVVVDPFAGSGSLGQAVAERGDGTTAVLCEGEEQHVRIIAKRLGVAADFRSAPLLAHVVRAGPIELHRTSAPVVHEELPSAPPQTTGPPGPELPPRPVASDPSPADDLRRPRRRPARPATNDYPVPRAAAATEPPGPVDDTPAGRVAACTTIAELTTLHATLKAAPGAPPADELWAMVSTRWDELNAAKQHRRTRTTTKHFTRY